MKRLSCFLLAIILLFPAAVFSEENNLVDLSGLWAAYISSDVNYGFGDQSIIIVLNHDGTMFGCFVSNIRETREISHIEITCKWSNINNNVIFQTDEKDAIKKFEYKDGLLWAKMDTMSFGLKRIPDFEFTQMKYVGN